jgi:hypothetical protein
MEFLFVQPGVDPAFGAESSIQLAHDGLVLRGMAEEDFEKTIFARHGLIPPYLFNEIKRQVEVICYR